MNSAGRVLLLIPFAICVSTLAGLPPCPPVIVENPGFEVAGTSATDPDGWRVFIPANRRTATDGLTPAALIRSGIASLDVPAGGPFPTFAGADTNVFNVSTFCLNDPAYDYGCGDALYDNWFAVPAANPFLHRRVGLKLEFRRDNGSVYRSFETTPFGPESNGDTGHTGGQWQNMQMKIDQADWDYQFNFFNIDTPGQPWPDLPTSVSLLMFRFGDIPGGETASGHVFFDDVSYAQDLGVSNPPISLWDDTEVEVVAELDPTILEPAIPVFFNGDSSFFDGMRIGYQCLPGDDSFNLVGIFDRVTGTNSYPQTYADIVANGFVRGTVQNSDGSTGGFGTSVVTAPSFRRLGQPLDLIPGMTQADVNILFNVPDDRNLGAKPIELGTPERTDFLEIEGQGDYAGFATVTSTRGYSADPGIGDTPMTVDYSWTASQNISLAAAAGFGTGADRFRLLTLSSMLADLGLGEYDARYIGIENTGGVERTVAISDAPRGVNLFSSAQLTGIGRRFTLYQDTNATFNPGSPTVEVTLSSVTLSAGAAVFGVQGFLATSTDPNDDSLSVWLEWLGAPATITTGTTVDATFDIRFLPPTDAGDIDHDGSFTCADHALLVGLLGAVEADANFDAYADLDDDGDIDTDDEQLLLALTGPGCLPGCDGDADGDGAVTVNDISFVIFRLGNSGAPCIDGDADGSGSVNVSDISYVIFRLGTCNPGGPCP